MGAQAVRLSNSDIDNALKNKDFEVLFQPIFDLGNGALARVETFVRWRHPSLGVLPPGAFISFFESQGRMSELTRYVLSEALAEYSAWRGPSAPGFSINLALSDLADDAFAAHFSVLLRDRGFPPDLITLECPMPPVTMSVEAAADYFRRLSETGARLAIEVRGRANDFLRQIDPFPFDEIKTGGPAILRFARTVRGPGLSAISELLEIASKANAVITAVGVEDQASLSALRGLGFAAAQGNHLGKVASLGAFIPSRVNDVRELLGLDPLSSEDLQALFRIEAPAPEPARSPEPPANAPASPEPEADKDALVERLAARLARQAELENEASAKAEAEAKAAAIARAKRKAAQNTGAGKPANAAPPANDPADDAKEGAAARLLQERLAREFARSQAQKKSRAEDALDEIGENFESAAPAAIEKSHDRIEARASQGQDQAMTEPDNVKPAATSKSEEAPESPDGENQQPSPVGEPFSAAAMTVANPRAFFRPGIRIGAVPPPAEDPAPLAGTLDDEEEIAVINGEIAPDESESPPAPSDAPGVDAAECDGEPAEGAVDEPHLDAGDEAAGAPAPQRPRHGNFLTRKYRLWPTHFWPRSWKRAYRRRQAEKTRRLEAAE